MVLPVSCISLAKHKARANCKLYELEFRLDATDFSISPLRLVSKTLIPFAFWVLA